ncbi:MAG TPA: iron-containing redox enzyme family protein [Candidatus Polarisedimenticolaceae bacterium]|nr:iron-containing redox enzyme family protein [Candidatus Polarisedimenticolaceae bacterium]
MVTTTTTIEQMLREITSHPALENDFYRAWTARPFGIRALEVFARNYGAWVKSFPDALAVLILSTDDLEAKGEYVKTLHSEMGYGHADKVHWVLLDAFLSQLSERMGHKSLLDRDRLEKNGDLLPTTLALIRGERELYAIEDRAFGAQLALEWQAYTMLRKLYDGARNYLPLWKNPDEFHESCEYFYVHIGAAEKDHKDESLHAVKRYARDTESVARITDGYQRHLDLIAGFWGGLHEATMKLAA